MSNRVQQITNKMSRYLIKLQKLIQDLKISAHAQAISHSCLGPARTTFSLLCSRKDERWEAHTDGSQVTSESLQEKRNRLQIHRGSVRPAPVPATHTGITDSKTKCSKVFICIVRGPHHSCLMTTKSLLSFAESIGSVRVVALDPVGSPNLLYNPT